MKESETMPKGNPLYEAQMTVRVSKRDAELLRQKHARVSDGIRAAIKAYLDNDRKVKGEKK